LAAEVGNIHGCKNLVANGKGLSFTLDRNIERELEEKQFKLVPLKEYLFITAVAVTRADISSPVISRFIPMVKQVFDFSETAEAALSGKK
jgi:hypothetical protein